MRAGPFVVLLVLPWAMPWEARSAQPLAARIEAVMSRPEHRHASFGVEVDSLTESCARRPVPT
jgi:hypothetical protein